MADGASLNVPACLPVPAGSIPPEIEAARAALAPLSDAQRLALVIGIVRDVRDLHCRLQLRRLINAADATAHELGRTAFEQGVL